MSPDLTEIFAVVDGLAPQPAVVDQSDVWAAYRIGEDVFLDGLRMTPSGDGARIGIYAEDRLIFVEDQGKWYEYEHGRWAMGAGQAPTLRIGKEVAHEMHRDVDRMPRGEKVLDEEHGRMNKWAKKFDSVAGMTAAAALAAVDPPIRAHSSRLDNDPMLFNVANGTVDLRTGELRPHSSADLITMKSAVAFDAEAGCPEWMRFLDEMLPDPEVRCWLKCFAGYCLSGRVDAQILPIFIGTGANGKSVTLNVLRELLGEYGIPAPIDLLIVQHNEPHPTSIATLRGRRLATGVEIPPGARLAEAKVKELTGGDELTARFMREDFWTFKPSHKLVLAANHLPRISGTDDGIWRRLRVVEFPTTIPPNRRDGQLTDRLIAELPGVLNWAIAWQRDGLPVPAAVELATDAFRRDSDSVAQFVNESGVVVLAKNGTCPARKLRDLYEEFCGDNSLAPVSVKAFPTALRALGLNHKRTGSCNVWEGIGLA